MNILYAVVGSMAINVIYPYFTLHFNPTYDIYEMEHFCKRNEK